MKLRYKLVAFFVALSNLFSVSAYSQTCSFKDFEAKKQLALDALEHSDLQVNQITFSEVRKSLDAKSLVIEQLPVSESDGGLTGGHFSKRGRLQVLKLACLEDVQNIACALAHEHTHGKFDKQLQKLAFSADGLRAMQAVGKGFELGNLISSRKLNLDMLNNRQKENLLYPMAYTICTEYGAYNAQDACMNQNFDKKFFLTLMINSYIPKQLGFKPSENLVRGLMEICDHSTKTQDGRHMWGVVNVLNFFSDVKKDPGLKQTLFSDVSPAER